MFRRPKTPCPEAPAGVGQPGLGSSVIPWRLYQKTLELLSRLRALVARLKKTLVAERKEQFIIFSACCEHVDHPTAIDFAELEAARGKFRMVRSVGEVLWFEAESGARAIAVVFREN